MEVSMREDLHGGDDTSLFNGSDGIVFPIQHNSLFDDNNITENALTLEAHDAGGGNDGGSASYLFFMFPVLGFLILVVGTLFLRKRQLEQEANAIRRYNERIEAEDAEKRANSEKRAEMVEKALVTTKAISQKAPRFSARHRSSTMETDVTSASLDSSSSTTSTRGDEEEGLAVTRSSSSPDLHEALVLEDPAGPMQLSLESCAICLEPYKENDSVSYSKHQNCNHAFHTSCISSWLKDQHKNDCPYCRGPYLHLCIVEDDGDFFGDNSSSGATGAGSSDATTQSSANAN